MKIIKKGTLPTDKFKGECHNCDSIIQADNRELNWEFDSRENDYLARKKCPVCKEEMFFYKK